MTSRSCVLLVLLASLAPTGCGLGRLVHPDEPLVLGGDTLFALAVHATEYVTLTFCRDADYASCLTTGQLPREGPIRLYALPPGRYCLMEILVEPETGGSGSVDIPIDAEQAPCFVARPDVIAYPGELGIDAHPTAEGASFYVIPRWFEGENVETRIEAAYPDLRGRPIDRPAITRYVP